MKNFLRTLIVSVLGVLIAGECDALSANDLQAEATELVNQLIKSENNRDIDAQMALYADRFTYAGKGVSPAANRKSKARYYARWPKTDWTILSEPQITRVISSTEFEVTYRASYRLESPERKKWSQGRLTSRLTLRRVAGTLLIAAIDDETSGSTKGDLPVSEPADENQQTPLTQRPNAKPLPANPVPVFQGGLRHKPQYSVADKESVRLAIGNESELCIKDLASSKLIGRKTTSGVGEPFSGAAFSPDGRYLFVRAGGNRGDYFLKVLDLDSFDYIADRIERGTSVLVDSFDINYSDIGLEYAGDNPPAPVVLLRNKSTGAAFKIPIITSLDEPDIKTHYGGSYLNQLIVRNKKYLYMNYESDQIVIYDLLTHVRVAAFDGVEHYITNDQNTIAVRSAGNSLVGYSLDSYERQWAAVCSGPFAVANDGTLFSSTGGGQLQASDAQSGKVVWIRDIQELQQGSEILSLEVSPDTETLAVIVDVGGSDSIQQTRLFLIACESGASLESPSHWNISWDGASVTFSRDSELLAHAPFCGRFNNCVQIQNLKSLLTHEEFKFSTENDGMGIRALCFGAPNGLETNLYFGTTDYPRENSMRPQSVGRLTLFKSKLALDEAAPTFFAGEWNARRLTAYEQIGVLSSDDTDGFSTVRLLPEGSVLFRASGANSGSPIVMLLDGFYSSRSDALTSLAFRYGTRAYPFEQFDLRLNRPDIVLERLGAPDDAVAIAKQLREKRLKRMGVTEEMLKPDFHVPELEIIGDVPSTTDADEINVVIKASDSKYPLERLKVFVNNVPVNGRDGESLRDQNTQTLERTILIKLAAGRNKIQVAVLNNAGAESLYANAEVNCTAQRPKPTLYAVALGVSDYANPDWNLKYAAKDARDVLDRLKSQSAGSYGDVQELLLTDRQVTKESLVQIKNFLRDATIDDTVLMFVAGHGLLDSNYDYYFGTTDIDFNNPAEKGIAFEEFDDLLAGLPSLKKSLLIDTCHAGELDEEEKTLLASAGGVAAPLPTGNGIAMRSIGTRGMNVKAIDGARGASEWYDRLQGLFVDLRRGSGSTILSSSAGAEYALESSEQQNGLFTYAVLEALDGKKDADTNKDGSVQMSELGEYVKKRVSELTNNKQTPNTRRVNLEGDFTLAKTE
jgi:hypothetical protein